MGFWVLGFAIKLAFSILPPIRAGLCRKPKVFQSTPEAHTRNFYKFHRKTRKSVSRYSDFQIWKSGPARESPQILGNVLLFLPLISRKSLEIAIFCISTSVFGSVLARVLNGIWEILSVRTLLGLGVWDGSVPIWRGMGSEIDYFRCFLWVSVGISCGFWEDFVGGVGIRFGTGLGVCAGFGS
jgi:hypothetical protein